jgi:hypothetical protein
LKVIDATYKVSPWSVPQESALPQATHSAEQQPRPLLASIARISNAGLIT